MNTISANVLVRNECHQVYSFVRNMIDAGIDEIIFLNGGSTNGTKIMMCCDISLFLEVQEIIDK